MTAVSLGPELPTAFTDAPSKKKSGGLGLNRAEVILGCRGSAPLEDKAGDSGPPTKVAQGATCAGAALFVQVLSGANTERTKMSMKPNADPDALLYSREHARKLLGNISIGTLKRLEANGQLTPVRLNRRSPTAHVFYRRNQLFALAQGGGNDAA